MRKERRPARVASRAAARRRAARPSRSWYVVGRREGEGGVVVGGWEGAG